MDDGSIPEESKECRSKMKRVESNTPLEETIRKKDVVSSKSRKRASPFRIKIGCLVTLRENPHGNHVDMFETGQEEESKKTVLPNDSMISVWVNPIAGRDESLALIGKRIRCSLPKHFLLEGNPRKVLEGEVVRLIDYHKRKPGKSWKVELLIDASLWKQHFQKLLPRVDEDVDIHSLPNEKAKRNYRNEIRIRGENKVIVKIRLLHPGTQQPTTQQNFYCLQWVIQKRVPAKLFQANNNNNHNNSSTKSKTKNGTMQEPPSKTESKISKDSSRKRKCNTSQAIRHVGDGNDSTEQQIQNWRWLVSRYHNLLQRKQGATLDIPSLGFIGQVIHMEPSNDSHSKTLAWVTLQRLVLPEHTNTGRLPFHKKFEVFYDEESNAKQKFLIPIEELIVLGTSLQRGDYNVNSTTDWPTDLIANFAYSANTGIYRPITFGTNHHEGQTSCHRCFRVQSNLRYCNNISCLLYEEDRKRAWCSECAQMDENMEQEQDCHDEEDLYSFPCCSGICDCQDCRSTRALDLKSSFTAQVKTNSRKRSEKWNENSDNKFFGMAAAVASISRPVDFTLDASFLNVERLPAPAPNAIKRVKTKGKLLKRLLQKQEKTAADTTKDENNTGNPISAEKEDYTVFKPTCAREASYSAQKRMKRSLEWSSILQCTDVPRNLREVQQKTLLTLTDPDDKTSASRAARAKQRRMLKGVSNVLGLDVLASRESQLRFGRSCIHAWGVFADRDIQQGDMIVEYRGEIIGNARAEKREKEYERAKLGCDYMFRIDKDTVCDATKLGNVARFINHSCEPNCYARIITVDGNKRIVLYAKKDIHEGEEICYDYKFPLEYDPKKRIPCFCGTRSCRGFMNWDKRYVATGEVPGTDGHRESGPGASIKGPSQE